MNNERLTIALEPPETPTSREVGVENLEFPMVISRIPRWPRTRSTQRFPALIREEDNRAPFVAVRAW